VDKVVYQKAINHKGYQMKRYPLRSIPDETYKKLRVMAAEHELSINKMILKIISGFLKGK